MGTISGIVKTDPVMSPATMILAETPAAPDAALFDGEDPFGEEFPHAESASAAPSPRASAVEDRLVVIMFLSLAPV
jgi:hypothetical protein